MKIKISITAFLLFVVLFLSCGLNKPVEVYKESFVDIQNAEPQYLYLQTMLPYGAALIRWENGYLMEKKALVPGAKWRKQRSFLPEGFVIKKQEPEGIKMIPVKYIEDWVQDLSGMYSAFTLKLGPSMNSSVAFFSFQSNSIIYNQVVTDRPKDPPAAMSISIKDTFFKPAVSDDGAYFAVVRYNFMNTSHVRVYRNGVWDKYEETDDASSPCFAQGILYCRQYDKSSKKIWLVSREYGKSPKRLCEIKENLISVKSSCGRVFVVTEKGVNEYLINEGKLKELFDYSLLRAGAEDFEIVETYLSAVDKEGIIIFFVNKKRENNEYVWRLSARRIQ